MTGHFRGWARYRSTPRFRNGLRLYEVTAPLALVRPCGRVVTVPAGFVTDLTTVPAFARGLLAPDGPWVEAAIVHDWLISLGDRHHADLVFREALDALGIVPWRARSMHAAVRLRTCSLAYNIGPPPPGGSPSRSIPQKPGHRAGLLRFWR